MVKEVISQKIIDSTANPAPLGLLGFGMTTILLNLHNAGFVGLSVTIIAMGIMLGGLAQIIAGIMEWKKDNTFGTTAFTAYGFFWLSLILIILLPKLGLAEKADTLSMGAYLIAWGLFSLVMFINTLKTKKSFNLQIVFGTVTLLFFLLAAGDITGSTLITRIAGYEGILCGFLAAYTASEIILKQA